MATETLVRLQRNVNSLENPNSEMAEWDLFLRKKDRGEFVEVIDVFGRGEGTRMAYGEL